MDTTKAIALTNINKGYVYNYSNNFNIAEGGLLAFVAPTVVNNGLIRAKLGKVSLAAGNAVTLDLDLRPYFSPSGSRVMPGL